MNEINTDKMCQACGGNFTTSSGENFCSDKCNTYYDNYLDDHKDDEY